MSKIYSPLKNFISKKMRMSHIYQPLMLIELIKGNGKSTGIKIARSFLDYDDTHLLLKNFENQIKVTLTNKANFVMGSCI
jgi:hypothetical protein